MSYPTFGALQTIVEQDLDLESEDFIGSAEMIAAFNEGVRRAEAIILKLGIEDDYFLSKANLTLTTGSSDVSLPSDILYSKIRGIVYQSGSRIFAIKRMKQRTKFEDTLDILNFSNGSDWYGYMLLNTSVTGPKIFLVPASKETSTTNVTIFYIRQATRMASSSTTCDIPGFESFIIKYVKWHSYYKEGHPNTAEAKADLDAEERLMIETLTEMVPDGDSTLEKDMTHYYEMS